MQVFHPVAREGQSLLEEISNSISHGLGLITAIVGTPFLILRAIHLHSTSFLVGVCIFSATMILLYLASTLYHAIPNGKTKRVFRVIDHSAVYLLIAGTYTPFMLGVLEGPWGWSILGTVWGLALIGVTLKTLGKASHPLLSTGLYVLLGWIILVAIHPLVTHMETNGLLLLVLGGLFYTIGVIFFAIDEKVKYSHFVWHLFVVAGTVSHYFTIYWYGA